MPTAFLLFVGSLGLVSVAEATPDRLPDTSQLTESVKDATQSSTADVKSSLGKLPLYFVANEGQVDDRVDYYVQGSRTNVYFTSEGVTYQLSGAKGKRDWAIKLNFEGANDVSPVGRSRTEATINYFKGSREDWTNSSTYSSLVYRDLWDGIDLVYKGTASEIKYSFIVHPEADPSDIKLSYEGADSVKLNRSGDIKVSTPVADFIDSRPHSFQTVAGKRAEVTSSYELAPAYGNQRSYEFDIGDFDPTKPLVIDPTVLIYAGYIGGSSTDQGFGIAVDSSGAVYITGFTQSIATTFPETGGPDLTHNGSNDAFVAKVAANGSALVYAGYIGGSSADIGRGIAVDSTGAAYVTGETASTEATFPEIGGPDLIHNGGNDAFVAKVAASGSSLAYAGYIGGSGEDLGHGIAVDSVGAAYVTGDTTSTEATFPEIGGPDLIHNGGNDAFVAKVAASGSSLAYAGYIGGSGEDLGRGIALDSAGAAYITGFTESTAATFPETGGPDLIHNGGNDAFVAKVAASGSSLVYAGYIGGSGDDFGIGIALDPAGAAYVTGETFSTAATFPETGGPDLIHNGGNDAFVAKVAASGSSLVYAGYIGGSSSDIGLGIAVDSAGGAYVTGNTVSTEATFPETDGPDLSYNGDFDAFVAKVAVNGSALVYAGYIGGSGNDQGFGIAVDSSGAAYVTGRVDSTEATFPETVGPDLTHNGFRDAFVVKVAEPSNSCTKSGTNLNITMDTGGTLEIDRNGTDFKVIATDITDPTCSGATVNNIDSVNVTGSPSADNLVINTSNGVFEPGQTAEGTGTSDIEFVIDLDGGTDKIDVQGGSGDDFFDATGSGIKLNTDDDADVTYSNVESVELKGGGGADTLKGSPNAESLTGEDGNDKLLGGGGADVLNAGNGDDLASGGLNADTINGGDGDDSLLGRPGSDDLNGGNDNDSLSPGGNTANDALDGGSGRDVADYGRSPSGVTVDLATVGDGAIGGSGDQDTVSAGFDDVLGIESLRGSTGNDTLRGNSDGNFIFGWNGDDLIEGRDGNDTLSGGAGNDTLNGENGSDQFHGGADTDTCDGGPDSDDFANDEGTCETELNSP